MKKPHITMKRDKFGSAEWYCTDGRLTYRSRISPSDAFEGFRIELRAATRKIEWIPPWR